MMEYNEDKKQLPEKKVKENRETVRKLRVCAAQLASRRRS